MKPTTVGILLPHPGVRVTSASYELFVDTDFEGVLNDKLIPLGAPAWEVICGPL